MKKFFVSILIFLLCISLFMTFPCKAATVWSDNFDDGNYDGWTVVAGNFSAKDHTLRSIGGGGLIIRPSSITTGTWSFDILCVNETSIVLMSNYPDYPTLTAWSGIAVEYYPPLHALGLYVAVGNKVAEYDIPSSTVMTGWQHFDVTRSSDGRVCVYLNGTLVMDHVIRLGTDTALTTSEYFCVLFGGIHIDAGEGAIDNIVVSNTIDIQPPPPSQPFYMQTWFLATVGAVIVVVAVVAVFFLRHKK